MRKKEFSSSGPGFYFTYIIYEGCIPLISTSDGVTFVEGDIIGIEIDFSAGRCFFVHNGKVIEEDRNVCK